VKVFIDTSAFFAFIDKDDQNHERSKSTWIGLIESNTICITSNYVIVETFALLQNRIGIAAVRGFQADIIPVLQVEWVDSFMHDAAVSGLLAASRKKLSLVDCSSFEIMRRLGVKSAFTFDLHYREQGFHCLP
jgi:uncharacterized protein